MAQWHGAVACNGAVACRWRNGVQMGQWRADDVQMAQWRAQGLDAQMAVGYPESSPHGCGAASDPLCGGMVQSSWLHVAPWPLLNSWSEKSVRGSA
ncbi:hypothetical protein CYMTET_15187 [Cymbomonas tetramitiformis]|uniref:Uncharacterized protein n=1 Tax=Cymbomonas tetramitiformis TaxID=36881 RepID=A0AAE0L997_9CHLO|nr:hypothetical protein CYMTET_15187 [Cymbomonas tetramitiformis]